MSTYVDDQRAAYIANQARYRAEMIELRRLRELAGARRPGSLPDVPERFVDYLRGGGDDSE